MNILTPTFVPWWDRSVPAPRAWLSRGRPCPTFCSGRKRHCGTRGWRSRSAAATRRRFARASPSRQSWLSSTEREREDCQGFLSFVPQTNIIPVVVLTPPLLQKKCSLSGNDKKINKSAKQINIYCVEAYVCKSECYFIKPLKERKVD